MGKGQDCEVRQRAQARGDLGDSAITAARICINQSSVQCVVSGGRPGESFLKASISRPIAQRAAVRGVGELATYV